MSGSLGRRVPTDWDHVNKFPLTALAAADRPSGVPVVIGVNWYTDFDSPSKDSAGRWWVAKNGIRGSVRGGHCVCVKPPKISDLKSWWTFYNQGQEGACVGFGSSRAMSLLNRFKYDARWLWQQARLTDEFPDNDDLSDNNQGTTVRAGLEILRNVGEKRAKDEVIYPGDGIAAYRWATDVNDVLTTLNSPLANRLNAIPFVNSWGTDYPHVVWMPASVFERLLTEDGEIGIITDK